MHAIDGYFLIKPEDLEWKPAKPMKIPYADFLERTKSEILGGAARATGTASRIA